MPFALRLAGADDSAAEEIPAELLVSKHVAGHAAPQIDFPIRAYVSSGRYQLMLIAGPGGTTLRAGV